MGIKSTDSSRSWFCVLNNPEKIFGDMEPIDMVNKAIEMWCEGKEYRSCACNYEIGDSGTPHMHMVLEDPEKARFSAIQKLYPSVHIEPTRGSKADAEAYIRKEGKFAEKNHTVIVPAVFHGEICANQGRRKDLEYIAELLEKGYTPNEIMDISINYRRYEGMIKKHYYRMREKATPRIRDVKVYWHVGDSGCGKSFTYTQLCDTYGTDNVYLLTDYDNGGFDSYCAENILFMDEFKGGLKFQTLLNYLDCYPVQIHCRYANAYALWSEVHITSIYPPEEVYNFMVEESVRNRDKITQLKRRINTIVYHYKDDNEYKTFELPMERYENYEQLKKLAENNGFTLIENPQQLSFLNLEDIGGN